MATEAAEAPPMHLFDLDPELLLSAMESLSARDQARAAQSCKLLAVIVHEIGRTTSFMVGAVAPLKGLMKECLDEHLSAAPSMGILFSTEPVKKKELTELAEQLPYNCEMVGGHMSVVAGTDAAGALTQTSERGSQNDEVGLQLGRFPEATVKSFAITGGSNWQAQLSAQGMLEPGWKVFLVAARHRSTHSIVDALQAAHPKAAIIGGMATGECLYRVRQRCVEELDEGVVGLMFSGEVPLVAFVSRGARALGEAACTFGEGDIETDADPDDHLASQQVLTHVTDAGGARNKALNAAITAVNEAGHGGQGICLGLSANVGDGYELTALGQEMVVAESGALVMPPRRGDDTSWTSGHCRFFGFDAPACKEDLTSRLEGIRGQCEQRGERLLGAVMFTCGGRTARFFGEPAFDATAFARTFERVPMIGMYAGGEIGPPLTAGAPPSKAFQVGGAEMHGFTAIFGLFIVPPRKPRDAELAFADDADIAAAYAEARANAGPLPPPRPPTLRESLPSSLAELRAMPIKALKQALARLGLAPTPGSEKEDLVQDIAKASGIGADDDA